ncbi:MULTISPECIES: nuclear transport factor 2 family protein [Prauserella salsuginis group]|uniref:Nuclear transport factor 2 family protein n=1 Tax=Prauserella salsuginis TaxID=387889 RepID=A0ABW6GAT0_9PSEU|nr:MULTISPECIES: nuclear transport factor 2 family protein [Prauserella salsuginis group]MCR3720631.1 3-phenylpropionate/cinnamic acid dioxygenase, small subunit [Prauserella flava]MCR3735288.1 3-phenylpropionate/cinnamic acid dioxygenase, small subunit [Prauserella salsuginis]
MTRGPDDDISTETLARVHQLYGAQSHFIDDGHADAWAATFTPDGEFHSPSYPEPVVGTEALTAFAERFARQDGVTRHVLTNLFVTGQGPDELLVRAYLQLVHTAPGGPSTVVRQTTIADRVVRSPSGWRIARRTVHRDDEPR